MSPVRPRSLPPFFCPEQLMLAYLLTDPMYATTLEKVWLCQDFPFRKDFSGKDTGIDYEDYLRVRALRQWEKDSK
ncbi:MAG: hypothetical protein WCR98_07035 [Saccharofermentanales bacterium]